MIVSIGLACSSTWSAIAIFKNLDGIDWNLFVPNAFGALLCCIQMLLFLTYYCRNINKPELEELILANNGKDSTSLKTIIKSVDNSANSA